MDKNPKRYRSQYRASWFDKLILNNKFVMGLLIILLLLLIIFVFSKIAYLFTPLGSFFSILGFPLILGGILYYLMNPLVNWLQKKGIKRVWSIGLTFVGLLLLIIWGIIILIPVIQEQTIGIIEDLPLYWKKINDMLLGLFEYDWFRSIQEQISQINSTIVDSVTNWANDILSNTVTGLGSVFGVVTNVFVGLVTMPILLYYLLKDGEKIPHIVLSIIPTKHRKSVRTLLTKINLQISQYVRSQIMVAISVGIMFVIGYSIIGLNYGIVLGILAGFLNVIPYIGSFLAMVPAIIIAVVHSPFMLLQVLIVFAIEQFIEGRVISPQILGSNLSIHPVTIIMVLLTAGKIFGLAGFVIGIPGYAVLKVVFIHVFEWYKDYSGLYHEEPPYDEEVILSDTEGNDEAVVSE
ncbi:AI-2E family transporter [Jeotgalibaca sp. MA1X17-3]|uniref:AI-2E family transporter n=1 Tax=Jeotgalibaca sp. MA1X17-3 TaxID=2908211 RepID=UPI001F31702E|nr:AI-2E family transporter [Jeotgalibaca sp. MA1X17-3]UJF16535.1 AI-2E family transporter [Jeotgalibaca sp. MA1X17-3]